MALGLFGDLAMGAHGQVQGLILQLALGLQSQSVPGVGAVQLDRQA